MAQPLIASSDHLVSPLHRSMRLANEIDAAERKWEKQRSVLRNLSSTILTTIPVFVYVLCGQVAYPPMPSHAPFSYAWHASASAAIVGGEPQIDP